MARHLPPWNATESDARCRMPLEVLQPLGRMPVLGMVFSMALQLAKQSLGRYASFVSLL